ncbi:serine/threonine-protein phosphatase 2A regulatory subunit A [Nematocida displodere]|uniref:Serine/threonine-protein phosphatase 2A regulatory subunit A n=1 Tax=Nematocida displodere TaxID=1805483 RepID=A0A177EDV6_9MICR|nr:serine/threonine-protein phosphatase 2A regulatory subunit A [Nematocida displodere]
MSEASTISYEEIEKEIERMQSTNSKAREESLQNLYQISKEIGQVYTKEYLIPFLKTILDTNEEAKDSVIAQMDKIVKELIEEVDPVLEIYQEIFLTRDEAIRSKAAEALISEAVFIGGKKQRLENELSKVEAFIRMLGESRFIMHRLSAVVLVKKFILEVEKDKHALEGLFKALIEDASLIVRKKALSEVEVLACFYQEPELLKLVEKVLGDPEDSVRSFFVYPLSLLPANRVSALFHIKIFKEASTDHSWQIRSKATEIIKDTAVYVYRYAPEEGTAILQLIESLVTDKEEMVREHAAKTMHQVLAAVPETKERILYFVDKASTDKSPRVRKIVPETLSALAEFISKEDSELFIFPIIRRLLTDDNTATKMETISKLRSLYDKLGSSAITEALAPVINDLESTSWRTRIAVLRSIASLSRQIEKTYFNLHLRAAVFKMFTDPVWAVRKEVAVIVAEIGTSFGAEWLVSEALPHLEDLKSSRHYAHRISYVTAAAEILKTLWPTELQKVLAGALAGLARDPVPQVRQAVAVAVTGGILEEKDQILQILHEDDHPGVVRASRMGPG